MEIHKTAPRAWDARIDFPILSSGYGEAAATVGFTPLYAIDGDASALVLVRELPVPLLRTWTARAKAYVTGGGAKFVSGLVEALRDRGIAHLRIGDGVVGLSQRTIEEAALPCAVTHLLEHAPAENDDELFRRLASRRRTALRRAEREGVVVHELRTEDELAQFCALATETARRARARDVGAVLPPAYFAAIFRTMVPRKQAVFFLARHGDQPLAGALFLTSSDRMTYFYGVSTRDPELTKLQGPTAVFWHALRVARGREIPRFDLGAVTPTDDPAHPNHSVYYFKREFGGYVTDLHHAELALAPVKYAFQERVMLPVWKRAHTLYMQAFGTRETPPEEALSGTDLRWAGVPTAPPRGISVEPPHPWSIDEVLAELAALHARTNGVGPIELSEAARHNAITFTRALYATIGRDVHRPAVAATVDGGISFTWAAAATARGYLVELVFFRERVEYAVVDGTDVTAPEQRLVDGETSDPGTVLREVVKRYVVSA
jgi:hypothetical protein